MPSAAYYKRKLAERNAKGITTTHAGNAKLEKERMENPAHRDYEVSKINKVQITAEEREKFKFLNDAERLLREFKIPYDYSRTDFIFQDDEEQVLCMWYDNYEGMDENIFIGMEDKEEYFEAFTNIMDAITYLDRVVYVPGRG
jgi:hypothetical protein